MRYYQDVEDLHSLRAIVSQDLKELGVKPPKTKKKSKDDAAELPPCDSTTFGNHLDRIPCLLVDSCGLVPRFLVEAVSFLESHVNTEGLFRKSGSVARQKELKEKIEFGESVREAHPLDVAALIKQFFRELPDPILTSRLQDLFVKCLEVVPPLKQMSSAMLLCLLLPWQHLCTLRFVARFLAMVAGHQENNKMDIHNLAVCMTPNFLHSSQKAEKTMGPESKMLQVHTTLVKLLIENADQIGMVSESLYDRIVLLGTCFPSEDELDKSAEILEESKPAGKKRKKKRSGSLQGLVNNLSNSFTRWRRDSKGHNQSNMSEKSSMISVASDSIYDASIISTGSAEYLDGVSLDSHNIMLSEVTPKVIRKRKASNEMMPFSATKKKAILQHMPQMSTLGGTPFTPMTKRGRGHAFTNDTTPNIRFTDGASQVVFNATPCQTPRVNMDRLLSPASTTKVKRYPSGKAGCFSPKTPKNKRRGVKGLLRRLSGGKEAQPSPSNGMMDSDEAALRLADGLPARPTIIHPNSRRKRSSLFRRHRKTPSSPGRLLTPQTSLAKMRRQAADEGADADTESNRESLTNTELAAQLQQDLVMQSPDLEGTSQNRAHQRGYSDGSTGLRRGRPNTVATGLPNERYQPSPNRSRRSMDGSGLAPPRHSSQRDIFVSPEKHMQLDCDAGVMDTSPIAMAGFSPVHVNDDEDIDDEDLIDEISVQPKSSRVSLTSGISAVLSTTSLKSLTAGDHLESEFDQAFIGDCTVLGEHGEDVHKYDAATTEPNDVFKKPSMAGKKVKSASDMSSVTNDSHDVSSGSDASDVSAVTAIYRGAAGSKLSTKSLSLDALESGSANETCGAKENKENEGKMSSSMSTGSIDSAISDDTSLPKSRCSSTNSLESVDSGLGGYTDEANKAKLNQSNLSIMKDSSESVLIQKRATQDRSRRCSGEPKLQLSHDMHHMLTNIGIVGDETKKSCAPFTAVVTDDGKRSMAAHESILDLQEQGKVTENIKQFDAHQQEITERHTSPLRFSNSVSRRRGTSPVRIPTIFARADKEASKYRDLAKTALSGKMPELVRVPVLEGKTSHRAKLPISTNLVRNIGVEHRLAVSGSTVKATESQTATERQESAVNSEGHMDTLPEVSTPCVPSHGNPSGDASLLDVPATPKIKPNLMNNLRVKNIGLVGTKLSDTPQRRVRSPVKPVKRLQGSPGSPHKIVRSPKMVKQGRSARLSPIPSHMLDWNI